MNKECTCSDDSQSQTIEKKCLQCQEIEIREMTFAEKRSKCPEHKNTIQMCGPFGYLCQKCRDKGYRLTGVGSFIPKIIPPE